MWDQRQRPQHRGRRGLGLQVRISSTSVGSTKWRGQGYGPRPWSTTWRCGTQMRRTTSTSTLAGAISQSVHLYTTTWYH
ncbi:hypothetical protein HU200_066568 [Digitaria exilis]|uniref:Uncharacterized protein n=1 Tax=Digitaria exilis TaxID=1010633 RepID=A0A835DWZ5_9POAL|nr:hypothetical protein HU200_066568 [Digitaria exilis]